MKKAVSILLSLFLVFSVMVLPAQAATSLKMPKSITSKKYGKMYDISVKGSTMNIKYCGPYATNKNPKYPLTNLFDIFKYSFIDFNKKTTCWNNFYLYADAPQILAVSPLRREKHINKVNITYPQDSQDYASYKTASYTFDEPETDKDGNTAIYYRGTITSKKTPGMSVPGFKSETTLAGGYVSVDKTGDPWGFGSATTAEVSSWDAVTDSTNWDVSLYLLKNDNNEPEVVVKNYTTKDELADPDLKNNPYIYAPKFTTTFDSNGRLASFKTPDDDPNNGGIKLVFTLNKNGQITKLASSGWDKSYSDTVTYNY